jgi:hypothetical protein
MHTRRSSVGWRGKRAYMPDQRFGIFLWALSCIGIWVTLARDFPTIVLSAFLTIVPTLAVAWMMRQARMQNQED